MFQSTRPMRGATFIFFSEEVTEWFQSTRPMRGATLSEEYVQELIDVSIHAPHAGRDNLIICNIL